MWSLLDADQEIPWKDQPLRYYQKYRIYFQEYKPEHHVVALPRAVWAIGAFIGVSVGPIHATPFARYPLLCNPARGSRGGVAAGVRRAPVRPGHAR